MNGRPLGNELALHTLKRTSNVSKPLRVTAHPSTAEEHARAGEEARAESLNRNTTDEFLQEETEQKRTRKARTAFNIVFVTSEVSSLAPAVLSDASHLQGCLLQFECASVWQACIVSCRVPNIFLGMQVAPWSKTGGLGDVCGSLPPALAARGHRVMVVAPQYQAYPEPSSTGVSIKGSFFGPRLCYMAQT